MGDVRTLPDGAGPFGAGRTRADLEAMPDDGHRYELLDGVLLMSPSPRPLHQRVVLRLSILLENRCPAAFEVLPAPVDVVLSERTVIVPDVVVGRRGDFSEKALIGPPVLSVEVLSPRTRRIDLELKRRLLEDAGCPNYWIVDPDAPSIHCLALRAHGYQEIAVVRDDEVVQVEEPFPVLLSAAELVIARRPR
jgi:Uma2 family endonuclease